jgi:hypothetical protein
MKAMRRWPSSMQVLQRREAALVVVGGDRGKAELAPCSMVTTGMCAVAIDSR